ncbi:hypothetical protein ACFE04_009235 [Oxalis oulophora]
MGDDYKFMKIRDGVVSVDQKVSFFGVVIEIGFPKKSKGTDYCCTLKVVDESHHNPTIPVVFFADGDGVHDLPRVSSLGDIIQLSHVKMKIFKGEASAVHDKKISSFALFARKGDAGYLPYQSSPNIYRRDQDKKIISDLRKWFLQHRPDEGSSDFPLFLRELREEKLMDIACKILHSCEVSKDVWMIFVWDGTDTRPCSIQTPLEDEMDNQLPLHKLPLSRDLLRTMPTVGTILRVMIDDNISKQFLHLLNAGCWIKFVNLLVKVDAGSWCGVLNLETRLRYIIKDDIVKESQRLLESRLPTKMGRTSFWCFPRPSLITEVDCDERVPCRTLMDILTHSEVTAKFKCVVRVLSALPWRAEDFRSPKGIYRIRLTLEDPTARIHAFIYAEDGEMFFGGYPPFDVLTKKWKKLLGVAVDNDCKDIIGASRNPPWVQCCIKSYYIDEKDHWGSRQFRIFSTKLLG